MQKILLGAAYYDEYMPYERLDKDIAMMKRAGINTVRIAESTWSTYEPQEGVFDFCHVERVLDAMEAAGIQVIVGTPTYAIPAWLAKAYPDILAVTAKGRNLYGGRQLMDITHPAYRFYGERIIRELMKRTSHRKCVIGFQLDNETKHYGTAGKAVQEQFIQYLQKKFDNDLDAMNSAFGLDYWSNRVSAWEDFPDVRGTINGSLGAEFEKFQRTLVDGYLAWQAAIVNEYRREDQFITQNFDLEFRGYSYGVQPDVDHFHAAKCLTIAGVDVYHPTQDSLTGAEIALCGDIARSLKGGNYLVMETQAQGFPDWTPYKGQLRLQAYSNIASGANSVMYWHWHSIHNACETYWRGILSHDFQENAVYKELCVIGQEFDRIGSHIVNLRKKNEVAILVSNEALTALNWFGIEASAAGDNGIKYNDVVRWIYDALFCMNVECDIVWPESENFEDYKAIIVPALYAASDTLLHRLSRFVEQGGTLVATFKTAFADENVKVRHDIQPHILTNCLGVHYDQVTFPRQVKLEGEIVGGITQNEAKVFMELLIPDGAEVLAHYDHYNWKDYAAITRNRFGKGSAYYLGCMTEQALLTRVLRDAMGSAHVELTDPGFPVIVRKGWNDAGKQIRFYLNYSCQKQSVPYHYGPGLDLLAGSAIQSGDLLTIDPWNLRIVES